MEPSNVSEKEPCVEKEKEKKRYDKCGKTLIIGNSG